MTDKVLFITGASSGIGAATARAAAAKGWKLGLMARSRDKLQDLAAELGGPDLALSLCGDVSELDDLQTALAELQETFGRIDAVFANAGRGATAAGTENGDPKEWHAMIHVNILGVLYTAKAALPYLRDSKGHFIITSSAAGRVPIKGSIYGATKWFVHGFGGNLAEEMREWGGRCTIIAPGMVNTPFFDQEKPEKLQPEDVAAAVMSALEQDPRACIREIYMMPVN